MPEYGKKWTCRNLGHGGPLLVDGVILDIDIAVADPAGLPLHTPADATDKIVNFFEKNAIFGLKNAIFGWKMQFLEFS